MAHKKSDVSAIVTKGRGSAWSLPSKLESTALPEAMPIRKVTRIKANACIEEPIVIDKARDHTTSYVMAHAPETANAQMATRRPRSEAWRVVTSPELEGAVISCGAVPSYARAPGLARRPSASMKVPSATLISTAARLVACTPTHGISTKLPTTEPVTAPNVLMAYSPPTRADVVSGDASSRTKCCASSGRVPPISVVGTRSIGSTQRKRATMKRKLLSPKFARSAALT